MYVNIHILFFLSMVSYLIEKSIIILFVAQLDILYNIGLWVAIINTHSTPIGGIVSSNILHEVSHVICTLGRKEPEYNIER